MSDVESEADYPNLPKTWKDITPNQIYKSSKGQRFSFSATQIKLGNLYDPVGKHLRAIERGIVSPRGSTGLVPSEVAGYDFKSKILGKGGDRRFHCKIVEGILHFPGKQTTH